MNTLPSHLVLPLLLSLSLSGCAVVSVAGAAAGAAISVTGAVVSTGVKVTGKVIEKTIDAVTPDGEPESDGSGIVIKESAPAQAPATPPAGSPAE